MNQTRNVLSISDRIFVGGKSDAAAIKFLTARLSHSCGELSSRVENRKLNFEVSWEMRWKFDPFNRYQHIQSIREKLIPHETRKLQSIISCQKSVFVVLRVRWKINVIKLLFR